MANGVTSLAWLPGDPATYGRITPQLLDSYFPRFLRIESPRIVRLLGLEIDRSMFNREKFVDLHFHGFAFHEKGCSIVLYHCLSRDKLQNRAFRIFRIGHTVPKDRMASLSFSGLEF